MEGFISNLIVENELFELKLAYEEEQKSWRIMPHQLLAMRSCGINPLAFRDLPALGQIYRGLEIDPEIEEACLRLVEQATEEGYTAICIANDCYAKLWGGKYHLEMPVVLFAKGNLLLLEEDDAMRIGIVELEHELYPTTEACEQVYLASRYLALPPEQRQEAEAEALASLSILRQYHEEVTLVGHIRRGGSLVHSACAEVEAMSIGILPYLGAEEYESEVEAIIEQGGLVLTANLPLGGDKSRVNQLEIFSNNDRVMKGICKEVLTLGAENYLGQQ